MTAYPPDPNLPPGYPQQQFAPQGKTSGTALTSMILGIIMCGLGVTSLVAVILGIVGIRATGRPGVRGRGFAITGVILGVLGLLLWGGIFAAGGYGWMKTAPDRKLANGFITDVGNGNYAPAMAVCTPSIAQPELQAAHDQIAAWGTFSGATAVGFNYQSNNGVTNTSVTGIVQTTGGQSHTFMVTLVPVNGTNKVDSFTVK